MSEEVIAAVVASSYNRLVVQNGHPDGRYIITGPAIQTTYQIGTQFKILSFEERDGEKHVLDYQYEGGPLPNSRPQHDLEKLLQEAENQASEEWLTQSQHS